MHANASEARNEQGELADYGIEITRLTNQGGLLTKAYQLGSDGTLIKATAAALTRGVAETVHISSLRDLADLVTALQHTQALAFGVTGQAEVELVTKSSLVSNPGAIARDREHFHFRRGPGVFMVDHDAEHASQPYTLETLRAVLIDVCPELAKAPVLGITSASSHVVNTQTGQDLTGVRGLRLYVLVVDATDIPRFGKLLYERLWAEGKGRFVVSKNGTPLNRNIIDAAVWQPERLDFAAGAHCIQPLEQRRPRPVFWNEGAVPLDTSQIRDLTQGEREQAEAAKTRARETVRAESETVRAKYIAQQVAELTQSRGIDTDQARHLVTEALDRRVLFPEFVLYSQDGDPVTVGEILDEPARWHGKRFADPIEPEYRDDRRVAWVNLYGGGRPYLYSHAHGGRRFELLRQPARLKVERGELSHIADRALEVIRTCGELYDLGDRSMARVADQRIYPVTATWLGDYLGRIIRFEKFDNRANAWLPCDVPLKLPALIHERHGERRLPELRALITAPTLRADGSVLDTPGYDAKTGLLYMSGDLDSLRVPLAPSRAALLSAFEELWTPFSKFPFVDSVSRGVFIAAVLTAAVRSALPTAPAFGFDAPAAGSGKTLLARSLSILAGDDGATTTPPESDEEAEKLFFSKLREGTKVLLLDNAVHPIGGAPFNMLLTSERFSGRILGQSETDVLPNSMQVLLTGNNLRMYGDAVRRVLVSRIDPKVENPFLRQFDFCPVQWIKDRRVRLVVAALTLIRGYLAAGAPSMAAGRLASFEQWDGLVRQTVCWLATLSLDVGLDDPAKVIETYAAKDESRSILGEVLRAWYEVFGAAWMKAGDVLVARSGVTQSLELAELGTKPDQQKLRAMWGALNRLDRSGKPITAQGLGRWLQTHEGQIIGSLKLSSMRDSHSKTTLWKVVNAEADMAQGADPGAIGPRTPI